MSQDYTVAKELASLKEIKQSAEQRISELSLNALNYVNDHRLHKASDGSEDAWPYFDVVVDLDARVGTEVGVYLKGSYETLKSAYDSQDYTCSMLRVYPKDEEEGEPAYAATFSLENLTLQANGSLQYPGNMYIYYFNSDNTISATRSEIH